MFIMMTINEVSFNRREAFPGFREVDEVMKFDDSMIDLHKIGGATNVEYFHIHKRTNRSREELEAQCPKHKRLYEDGDRNVDQLLNLDRVTTKVLFSLGKAKLHIHEDNEVVTKIVIKGRC